jgi:intracellular sulfur oxidation DsrE/DsrF family protein
MIEDCTGLTRARAVWDVTTGDPRRFADRLGLLLHALESFRAQGIAPDFVVLLHGPATQFASRTLAGTKFDPATDDALGPARAALEKAVSAGARVEVCRIAMDRCHIGADNLLPGLAVEENVFVNAIALQNRGYAYLPIA